MTLKELKEALKDNEISYSYISTAELVNIYKFVNVNLQMDSQTLDYYYEIDVEELLNSDFPSSELETLKKQGWAFNKENNFLNLYLKN
jgi:hypothetical protein